MANNPKLQGSAPVQGAVRQPAAQLQGSGPIQGAARSPALSPPPASAVTQAPKPTAAPAAASWRATNHQPTKPPTSPITAQPGYRPSAKPPAPAAPKPGWQAPPDQGYQKDRAAELYQKGMDSTMANQQANRDAARMNAAWKSAPKVDPKTLVNPSGAKIPGIAAPDQQTGPGPKINRLTGKPMQVGYVGGGGVATPKPPVAAVPKPGAPKPPVPVAPAVKQPSLSAGSAVMSQRAGFTPKPVIGGFPAKGRTGGTNPPLLPPPPRPHRQLPRSLRLWLPRRFPSERRRDRRAMPAVRDRSRRLQGHPHGKNGRRCRHPANPSRIPTVPRIWPTGTPRPKLHSRTPNGGPPKPTGFPNSFTAPVPAGYCASSRRRSCDQSPPAVV
jgi:hypothetical protein